MALPVAGAIEGAAAKNMAKAFTMMKKTDWEGVTNAMQQVKEFGESASVIQETLGDINSMATSLVDIALGDTMAEIATKASELFDALSPIAEAIGNLTGSLDTTQLDTFITVLKAFNLVVGAGATPLNFLSAAINLFTSEVERGKAAVQWVLDILAWILGAGPPPDTKPDFTGGDGLPTLPGKIGDLEGGF